jgi:2-keto-4-pentenoate hydratase/2-oxohepta-3-ene-1,7-dioic acid hydratase in catechol pathway
LFLKPPSSLLGPDGTLELPETRLSSRVEHEVELGIVIAERARRSSLEQARAAIFGYTVVGDVTARDLQSKDKQWTRAKGMDGFCPVGPVVVSELCPSSLGIRCRVNQELRQSGSTKDMVFSPEAIVAYASETMTLHPGDLIATGTPEGVGPLVDGDRLALEIDGIGELVVHVKAAGGPERR